MGTWITGLVLLGVVSLIVSRMAHDKKMGKSIQCGGECNHCGGHCNHN